MGFGVPPHVTGPATGWGARPQDKSEERTKHGQALMSRPRGQEEAVAGNEMTCTVIEWKGCRGGRAPRSASLET